MLNEFRQDPVSGDWVLYATARGIKPQPKDARLYQTADECPFEPQRMREQEKPVAVYNHGQLVPDISGEWTVVVFPNKYPAVNQDAQSTVGPGIFSVVPGRGFHELVVTRDHDKHFATFTEEETTEVLSAYLDRYRTIAQDPSAKHVFIFHNHGHFAGASVYHNHSQIISMPIIPSGTIDHLQRSQEYFDKNNSSLYDAILAWENKEKKRIVHENDKFIVLCPYVSRSAYEMRIFPKVRSAYFEDMTDSDKPLLAQALNVALKKLNKCLGDPDYTFFVHAAPPRKTGAVAYDSYHWHIEIMPRFSIVAGQEFGTNVFVNSVDPDDAAELLRATQI